MEMPYSRFFWPCLVALGAALAAGTTPSNLARNAWDVGLGVITRAAALMDRLRLWVETVHRELTDGKPARPLELMVKVITAKLGRPELVRRWYRHRYHRRFGRGTEGMVHTI
jgi:hypothetical protein